MYGTVAQYEAEDGTQQRRQGWDTGSNWGLAKARKGQRQVSIRHAHQCTILVYHWHGELL